MIPYGHQSINEDDIESVISVLESDWLTQGPMVERFESILANTFQAKHAIAVSNGTAALHSLCLSIGLTSDDILWTTPNSFVASANCALYCGAKVDFVDIDPKTYNLSYDALEKKIKQAKKENKLPKILVVVHFAGQSCDMKKISALVKPYNIKIVEDACHAIGSTYLGKPVGCCQFSDATVFSFHPVKTITTGEGGAILCNDDKLAEKTRLRVSHGITRDQALMLSPNDEAWYYEQVCLGYNYRLSDIHAALGISQIKRLKKFKQKRKEVVNFYNLHLEHSKIVKPYCISDSDPCWHLYVIQIQDSKKKRDRLFQHLRSDNIGVNVHYIPIHTQPYYKRLGFKTGDFPNSEKYSERALTLPLHTSLGNNELKYIIDSIYKGMQCG